MRLIAGVAAMVLGLAGAGADERGSVTVAPVPLPHLPLGLVNFASGKAINMSVSPGAGAFRSHNDPPGRIWTITDRGPSVDCTEERELVGPDGKQLCSGGSRGRIYLLPGYAPSIYAIDMAEKGGRFAEMIVLSGASGKPLTGIANPVTRARAEAAVSAEGETLALDPSGVSPGALVRLANGTFWVADNYGPSLLEVAGNGKVLRRLVPGALAEDYRAADYPVEAVLPDILSLRQVGRGFEGLALSADETVLYAAMQSAVMNPDINAYRASPAVRILKIDRASGRTLAQYLYRLDTPAEFYGEDTVATRIIRQSDVRITEIAALEDGRLLVIERLRNLTRIYRIDPGSAVPLPPPLLETGTAPTLEATAPEDWAALGARPMEKTAIFQSGSGRMLGSRLNGMAVLSDREIAVIANNDFGIDGSRTQMFRLTFPVSVLK